MEDIYKVGEKWLKTAVDTTSTIASTTTAIVATSSARALGIIGSTSGRPEVPARAAAAAAVARKIAALPPHERLSLPSTSDGTTSVYGGRRPRGEPADELEENFYEEGFDPVRFLLEHLPEESSQMTQQYFESKVGGRLLQLDVVTEKLSKQVMENHEEMVQGMQLVTELDRDLQLTSIICKNGRRFLSMAAQEVSQDLLVAANVRKKQVLLDLLPVLERIQLAMETKSQLDSAVDEGDFAKALQLCSECLLLLEDCSTLKAVEDVNNSIEEWLHRTVDKVDKVLLGLCSKFEADKYATVVQAYIVLDDITGLAEKAQTYYAQILVSETHSVIRNLVFEGQDPQVILQKSRVPYNDLCAQLTESKFKECLHKSLEVLFDLMSSYHQMMTWLPKVTLEKTAAKSEITSTPLANGRHRRSGSYGDLLIAGEGSRHARTGSLSSSELARFSSSSQHGSPRFANLKPGKHDIVSSNGSSISEDDFRGALDDSEHGRTIRVREAVLSIGRGLEKGRKTVWELSARRVAVLLSCDALCATSPHHFLQSLDWVNKFILAGEAFCGAEAMSLRAKLVKQSEKYYWSFHRQNLEVLRMILEKELWQQLSPAALKTLNFHAGIVNGAPVAKTSQDGVEDVGGSSRPGQVENALLRTRENVSSRAGFEDWLEKGNPFSDRKSQKVIVLTAGEGKTPGKLENGNTSSQLESVNSNGGSKKGSGEDEEDENEDLLADFIDEDSQLPGRRLSEQRRRPTKNAQLQDNEGTLILTSSAVSLLRYMDKYVKLMQILQPIVSEVFRGLCQLFELYFFTIFKVFGQRDHLSFSLRATLVRISQGLEEQRIKLPMSSSPSVTSPSIVSNPIGSLHLPSEPSPSSMGHGGPAIPMSPSNLHALKERSVAVESLLCLSQILNKSYLHFKAVLPQDTQIYMDTFFTQTVELVPELREHIYRVVARLLLNIGGYIDRISNVRWELKELGMEHNGYIDLLLGEYKQYSNKLAQGGVPKEVREAMLECGVDVLAETILEGISRVKRCNNEGRALMSLDLQVLINGLRHLASPKLKSNLLIVETYIKAFYLPETEYFHWIRAHPEYTKAQVVGLINLVASTYNWKRKTRMDLLEKIETGDL
ncbi:syndetin [Marchantia polymorpha subsp. ruderalis]